MIPDHDYCAVCDQLGDVWPVHGVTEGAAILTCESCFSGPIADEFPDAHVYGRRTDWRKARHAARLAQGDRS